MDGPYSQGYDFDVWGNVTHKYGWGGEVQGGTAGQSSDIYYSYTGNRRNGFSYDAAGNLTNDIGQNYTYDVTGQQTASTYTNLQNAYDGDGLRVKRTEDGLPQTYYLRSSVLGGQVVAEITWTGFSWQWNRGYVYLGSQLLAVQQAGVYWMHEDPVTKSKRVTNSFGAIVSTIELDPWGADTNRSSNAAFQPKKFTSYERDGNGSDEAMFRRYNRWHSRFDQPDPSDSSYDLGNPQSFNRYAYVNGDPVNLVDPSGLDDVPVGPCPQGNCNVDVPIPPDNTPIGLPPGVAINPNLPPRPGYGPGGVGGTPGGGPGAPGNPQNPAQPTLGPCDLATPEFSDLAGHPALGLLSGPFDDDPEALYNSLGTYNQAVLLNTTAALSAAGVNLGNANFIGFYRSKKPGNVAFGIEVTGVGKGDLGTIGPSRVWGYRSPGAVKIGSVEATFEGGGVVAFDVDLFNPKSNFGKHMGEVNYNNSHNTTTHPGDVAKQLAARGVNSGVGCQ